MARLQPRRPQNDQFLGTLYRQPPQQDLVHEGKDRRIGADPERQRKNSNRRERGALRQHAQTEPNIIPEIAHHPPHTSVAGMREFVGLARNAPACSREAESGWQSQYRYSPFDARPKRQPRLATRGGATCSSREQSRGNSAPIHTIKDLATCDAINI